MRFKSTALWMAITVGCAVTASYAAGSAHEDAVASRAKVSMNQAITVAEEQGSGQAIDAQFLPKSCSTSTSTRMTAGC